jgi:hypothetical protein
MNSKADSWGGQSWVNRSPYMKGNKMSKSTGSKAPPTKTFTNTAEGREQAYKQAQRQGESSVTFKIPPAKPSKTR